MKLIPVSFTDKGTEGILVVSLVDNNNIVITTMSFLYKVKHNEGDRLNDPIYMSIDGGTMYDLDVEWIKCSTTDKVSVFDYRNGIL